MSKKITVIGVGNAGVRVIDALAQMCPFEPDTVLIAVDTDAASLNAMRSEQVRRIEAGFNWTQGQGCGGDLIRGERCIGLVRDTLVTAAEAADVVILAGGVGGGTASGGLPLLHRAMIRLRKPVIILAETPFSFEGDPRHANARTALKELEGADVLLPVSNDLLFSSIPYDTPAPEAFQAADHSVARALSGLCQMLRTQPLIPAGYPNLRSLLIGKRAEAGIGVAYNNNPIDPDRLHTLLTDLVSSPLLGGSRFLREASALLCVMTGSSEISIGEMRKALDSIKVYFPPQVSLVTGVHLDPSMKDELQMTVIALKYDPAALAAAEGKRRNENTVSITQTRLQEQLPIRSSTSLSFEQSELPLQELTRGVFTNAPLTLVEGSDLDIPTYQRLNVQIEQGR